MSVFFLTSCPQYIWPNKMRNNAVPSSNYHASDYLCCSYFFLKHARSGKSPYNPHNFF
jgi:hypothetical protein